MPFGVVVQCIEIVRVNTETQICNQYIIDTTENVCGGCNIDYSFVTTTEGEGHDDEVEDHIWFFLHDSYSSYHVRFGL